MKESGKKIDVLIIGAGMFVCGRGTKGFGTVLPAVMMARKEGLIDNIYVAGRNRESFATFNQKLAQLNEMLGEDVSCIEYPQGPESDEKSYEKAIDQLPDSAAVIIAIPDHLHYEAANYTIDHKKNLLVVKPLTPDSETSRELAKKAQAMDIYGAVEFHKRFDSANLKMLQLMRKGAIGNPLYFLVEYSQRKSVPLQAFSQWADKTSIFQYLGVHYVDIIYFLTGSYPVKAMAVGQKQELLESGLDTWDAIQAIIEWKDPESNATFSSVISCNWIDPENTSTMSYQAIKVIGTKGRIESDQKNRGFQVVSEEGLEDINPYFCQDYPDLENGKTKFSGYGIESVVQFLRDCSEIASGNKEPHQLQDKRPTFKSSIVSSAVIEAVHKSLEQDSAWISIGPLH